MSSYDAVLEGVVLSSSHIPNFTIPGMLVGCFPLNALLQSTLECLFDSTCLELLQSSLLSSSSLMVKPLNDTAGSNFHRTTTVQTILAKLMIEEWISTSNYSNFYEQCHSVTCTYSFVMGGNFGRVGAIVIALFGGLSITLKVAAPIIDTIYQRLRRKFQGIRSAATIVEILVNRKFSLRGPRSSMY